MINSGAKIKTKLGYKRKNKSEKTKAKERKRNW